MPLRSVKMYGFIRGSHLLVRCPKWTPLSSRAFMEITAIVLLTFPLSNAQIDGVQRNEFSGNSARSLSLTRSGTLDARPRQDVAIWFRYIRTQPPTPGRDYNIEILR